MGPVLASDRSRHTSRRGAVSRSWLTFLTALLLFAWTAASSEPAFAFPGDGEFSVHGAASRYNGGYICSRRGL